MRQCVKELNGDEALANYDKALALRPDYGTRSTTAASHSGS